MELKPKKSSESETTITELMIPSYANFGGKIHGGILLSLMDKVAYACASKHAGNYCVTVSVDNVDFLKPVDVGDLVSLKSRVNYVGNTSLVVGIRVEAENVKKHIIRHTNTCYFTMVAQDKDYKPAPVPPLILESREEIRRFMEAVIRKYLNRQFRSEMSESSKALDIRSMIDKLREERCIIDETLLIE